MAWHRVYLALTAISTVLLALMMADVPPFGDLSPTAAGAVIVALFAAASVGHWYDARRARRRERERPPDLPGTLDEEIRYRENSDEAEADETWRDRREDRRENDEDGGEHERGGRQR
ncbi:MULTISPECIES: hypothetical protein [Halorussus]|uniref:hypothetical protein n=1 Tax=Halorussus TaxID=1070314 RepID=UPI0013B430E4|nr:MULTISPECIES: hypothetical protein [Halorussus]NHN59282.1 hypothetical protein [Halorussus sp. JP-T4]